MGFEGDGAKLGVCVGIGVVGINEGLIVGNVEGSAEVEGGDVAPKTISSPWGM